MLGSMGGKKSLPHTGVSGRGTTSKVLDLFGSASSAYEDEAACAYAPPEMSSKSPSKTFQKPSDVPPTKGTSIHWYSIPFSFLCLLYLSGHMGSINRDAVCGLLAECLQDVSSAMFAMPY
jgi:hypothetical protein